MSIGILRQVLRIASIAADKKSVMRADNSNKTVRPDDTTSTICARKRDETPSSSGDLDAALSSRGR